VVPFTMSHVAPRALPPLPWLSSFPELNVRTYVSPRDGKRGVFFFSLDAARLAAVAAARAMFRLPYYPATMQVRREGDTVHYASRRWRGGGVVRRAVRAHRAGVCSTRGSLAFFLTERYCLYHLDRWGRPARSRSTTRRGSWQPARAEIQTNTMVDGLGLRPADERCCTFRSARTSSPGGRGSIRT
jgi:uncharacterized protein YqjF (DUF2071 family)